MEEKQEKLYLLVIQNLIKIFWINLMNLDN